MTDTSSLTMDEIQKWEMALPEIMKNITTTIKVDTAEADMFKGDFSGLLLKKGIPIEFHYPNMRANGFKTYSDYDGKIVDILVVSEKMINRYNTFFKDR